MTAGSLGKAFRQLFLTLSLFLIAVPATKVSCKHLHLQALFLVTLLLLTRSFAFATIKSMHDSFWHMLLLCSGVVIDLLHMHGCMQLKCFLA